MSALHQILIIATFILIHFDVALRYIQKSFIIKDNVRGTNKFNYICHITERMIPT